MRVIGFGILGFVLMLGFGWVVEGDEFFLTKFFSPKYEAVRRETFEESKAYNSGMAQELQAMQFEYVTATPEQKDALASVILHRTADYDMHRLPPDLRSFVESLREGRLHP